ncbi:uncharacterized protein LOC135825269 [Sycon ciliatum]|uniref:uncharacterized protein LOC135825269 n=1 Tax=Sycon ciliatum TaxID=27933 RepID=UPI0020AD4BC6|eukprot:scpid81351/ scgid22347/ Serine/threonine-protein kinase 33
MQVSSAQSSTVGISEMSDVDRPKPQPMAMSRYLRLHSGGGRWLVDSAGRAQLLLGAGIDRGAFGCVMEAWDCDTRKKVAVKEIARRSTSTDPSALREYRLGSSLNHPGIVHFLYCCTTNRSVLLVMELLEGHSLCEILQVCGGLAVRDSLDITQQLIAAISYLHERHLVHRDVKTRNVMVGTNLNFVKLIDFGMAERVVDGRIETVPGTGIINMCHAPEIILASRHSYSVDVFGLGTVFYSCLTGYSPFAMGCTTYAQARTAYAAGPDETHQQWKSLTQSMQHLLRSCLHSRPEFRPSLETLKQSISRLPASSSDDVGTTKR